MLEEPHWRNRVEFCRLDVLCASHGDETYVHLSRRQEARLTRFAAFRSAVSTCWLVRLTVHSPYVGISARNKCSTCCVARSRAGTALRPRHWGSSGKGTSLGGRFRHHFLFPPLLTVVWLFSFVRCMVPTIRLRIRCGNALSGSHPFSLYPVL